MNEESVKKLSEVSEQYARGIFGEIFEKIFPWICKRFFFYKIMQKGSWKIAWEKPERIASRTPIRVSIKIIYKNHGISEQIFQRFFEENVG